ncbi:hypothetical protein FPZ43_03875 [Mucilaginibacter pallidiroseus]|uniref:EMC2 TPR-like domain-containing protein n=1 Tax=Mucilaginibacter pallidiroseus TaxID=2599295 RepID=A0A563UJQ8_9SPHI|nr:tetratricopeptide repeat protein [Mucilaginibacter pallidiroseus]TWR31620.1 hypothetical protein FPZ43_03875 [Mucilaginibacter pallidiroseus]
MKTFSLLSILIILYINCLSQDNKKIDDARLLEYYQNQKFAEAADYLKGIYAEPFTDLKALSQLAYTSNMAGRLVEAEKYYLQVYSIDSTNTGTLFSLGSINLRRGNNVKAEKYYREIISRDSLNFIAYKQLATISGDKNDIASKIAYLQRANKLNPADAEVASDLSDLYVAIKFTDQAARVLNTAIAADPENIVLLQSLMKLISTQKKWPETVEVCNKLLKAGNESAEVFSKLGIAYYNLKQYSCGAETFAQIDKEKQNESIFYFAAMCYKELKDQNWAIYYLNKAIVDGISPNIASYYGEIADSNEKKKRFKKAIESYQKAFQFDAYPMLYYSLASLYESELKDRVNAAKYYKKYIAAKPPLDKQQKYIEYAKSRITAAR